LRIYRNDALVYSDRATLSSKNSRRRYIEEAKTQGVELEEDHLVAIAEAVLEHRREPRFAARASTPSPPAFSGRVPATVDELLAEMQQWYEVVDRDALPIVLGAVAAHRFGVDPVWLVLVGPPSSLKTELIRLLGGLSNVYPLSKLTQNTLASGLKTDDGQDPSLLSRLTDQILLLKDLTTVLEMQHDARQEVLAQLREVYDGHFDAVWGTGKEMHWQGRLGLIAGVTPVIDRHAGVMGILGPRFTLFRMTQPDRTRVSRRAVNNTRSHVGAAERDELRGMVTGFLSRLSNSAPAIPDDLAATIGGLAEVVTRARSGVERDGRTRDLEYAPEPEMPARLAKQLASHAQGIALVHHRDVVTADDVRCIIRVGLDCIPRLRRDVIEVLLDRCFSALTTSTVASAAQYPTSTVRRALEDLQALGLVRCFKSHAEDNGDDDGDGSASGRPPKTKGNADTWALVEPYQTLMPALYACLESPTCVKGATDEALN
jgi:hypothetical protein